MEHTGPPTPPGHVEQWAHPQGVIMETHPSYTGEIETGVVYVFVFCALEMTGVCIRHDARHVTLRTKTKTFTVEPGDILRPAR